MQKDIDSQTDITELVSGFLSLSDIYDPDDYPDLDDSFWDDDFGDDNYYPDWYPDISLTELPFSDDFVSDDNDESILAEFVPAHVSIPQDVDLLDLYSLAIVELSSQLVVDGEPIAKVVQSFLLGALYKHGSMTQDEIAAYRSHFFPNFAK
jgi:hypothetical protein